MEVNNIRGFFENHSVQLFFSQMEWSAPKQVLEETRGTKNHVFMQIINNAAL